MDCVAKFSTPVPKYARHCVHEVKQCQIVLLRCRPMAVRKRRKPETTTPPPPPPTLTTHQIVAYNFARARTAAGWTQVETSDRLEPYLGYKLNQAGVSAIEKTYDSERRRNIDTSDVVAFARCFRRPIGWFFLPPPGRGGDLVEPIYGDRQYHLPAADLVALTIGTPAGWRDFLDRVGQLIKTDRELTVDALHYALEGYPGTTKVEDQINLRRLAIRAMTLSRYVDGADEVITQMAQLLIQLVNLTPQGMANLRATDPDHALVLLQEGETFLPTSPEMARRNRELGIPSSSPFDDVEEIDLDAVIRPARESED